MVLFLLIALTVVDSALTVAPRLTISPSKEVIYYQDGDQFNITCHGENLPMHSTFTMKSIYGDEKTFPKSGRTVNFSSKTLIKNVTLTKNESHTKIYCALAVYESATDNYEEKYVSNNITFVLNVTENATKDNEQNIEDGVNMETEPEITITPAKEVMYYKNGDQQLVSCTGRHLKQYSQLILIQVDDCGIHHQDEFIVRKANAGFVSTLTLHGKDNGSKVYCAVKEYSVDTNEFQMFTSANITFILKTSSEPEITIAPAKDVIYYKDGDQQLISCTAKHIRQYVFSSLMQVNDSGIHSLQQYLMLKNASNRFVSTLTLHGRDNGSKVYCAVEDYNVHTNQFEVKFTSANITFILNTSSEPEVTIAPAKDVIYYKDGDQQLVSCTGRQFKPYVYINLMQVNDYGKHYVDSCFKLNGNNRFAWTLTLHESNNGSKVYCDVKYYNGHTKEIEDVTSANITFISKTSSGPKFSSSLIDIDVPASCALQ